MISPPLCAKSTSIVTSSEPHSVATFINFQIVDLFPYYFMWSSIVTKQARKLECTFQDWGQFIFTEWLALIPIGTREVKLLKWHLLYSSALKGGGEEWQEMRWVVKWSILEGGVWWVVVLSLWWLLTILMIDCILSVTCLLSNERRKRTAYRGLCKVKDVVQQGEKVTGE